MNEFTFDIETCPDENVLHLLPPPDVKYGNVKDPAKKKEKEKEAKEKQLKSISLDPFFSHICSYAICGNINSERVEKYSTIEELTIIKEFKLISEIFQLFTKKGTYHPTVIIWAGKDDFDMRFLYTRAAILGVNKPSSVPSFNTMTKKYSNTEFINLMQVICEWGKYLKLDTASKIMLGKQKIKHDFTKFVDYIKSGNSNIIGKYNLHDAKLTYELYLKIKPYFLDIC